MSEKHKTLPRAKKALGNDFSLGITLQFVNTFPGTGLAVDEIPDQMQSVLTELERKGWIEVREPSPDAMIPRLTESGTKALERFAANGHFRKNK